MRQNKNTAPKAVALLSGAALALSACSSETQAQMPMTAPPTPDTSLLTPYQPNPERPGECAVSTKEHPQKMGKISKLVRIEDPSTTDSLLNIHNSRFRILDIADGDCAAFYKDATEPNTLLGEVRRGAELEEVCTFTSAPAGPDNAPRIKALSTEHKFFDISGSLALTDVAVQTDLAIPGCEANGITDNGARSPR